MTQPINQRTVKHLLNFSSTKVCNLKIIPTEWLRKNKKTFLIFLFFLLYITICSYTYLFYYVFRMSLGCCVRIEFILRFRRRCLIHCLSHLQKMRVKSSHKLNSIKTNLKKSLLLVWYLIWIITNGNANFFYRQMSIWCRSRLSKHRPVKLYNFGVGSNYSRSIKKFSLHELFIEEKFSCCLRNF